MRWDSVIDESELELHPILGHCVLRQGILLSQCLSLTRNVVWFLTTVRVALRNAVKCEYIARNWRLCSFRLSVFRISVTYRFVRKTGE